MGMGTQLQPLVVMDSKVVNQSRGMVKLVGSRRHLVMVKQDPLQVMVNTPLHNLDTLNKQLQTALVMHIKGRQIQLMVAVQEWPMVLHLFRLVILSLPRFSLVMTRQFLNLVVMQPHNHRCSHKQVMVSMIVVRCMQVTVDRLVLFFSLSK